MTKRRRRHGPEEKVRKLRDADAMLTVGELCLLEDFASESLPHLHFKLQNKPRALGQRFFDFPA